ncbi:beta-lactamase family protein [Lutimonas saemankumensis]|uniref:serine hydrolase domain-containing protein n=1 Tax=Lutimonas saemankumensis TaxID=483016 RepID=UPI001CD50BBF|nr:serine hydrolase domain-containing protein [Lutimonas saemankumensis]MCA0931305.1 beta-lactamase family protein [Lutimonas saemankumensis]
MIRILLIGLILTGCNFQKKKEAAGTVEKPQCITNLEEYDTTTYSVEDAMQEHGLKGLSIAVFENYNLICTQTWGVKDAISNDTIDENTAFSTASMAKPITATLFAILEEQGMISLDVPVSNYLMRWQLPKSEYLSNTEVTLRQLLSHTAGTTQHGFADFYKGDTIPTLVESLQGQLPNYDEEIDFKWIPGSDWGYSGGGYVIAQMAVEDKLGVKLSDLANRYLFEPLGMSHTTLKQPHEEGFSLTNLAKAHNEEGIIVGDGIPITPQVAASGLWSTPSDLAIFLIEMQNALRNENNGVISQDVAIKVTDIITTKVIGGWSLGWERRYGFGNYEWFSHGGANTGVGGHMYATMQDGNGIVMLGNGANKNRLPVINKIRDRIIINQKWHIPLDTQLQKPLTQEVIDMVTGSYTQAIFPEKMEIIYEKGKLFVRPAFFPGATDNSLIYIGNNEFIMDGYVSKIIFKIDEPNHQVNLYTNRNGTSEIVIQYRKSQ